MAFSSVFPFLLPTRSVDCAVYLLLSHSRALLVSSALFHPFTALKCPFDGPFTALKCPFDGPFTALKCPFQMAPCPSENLGRTLNCYITHPYCMILQCAVIWWSKNGTRKCPTRLCVVYSTEGKLISQND